MSIFDFFIFPSFILEAPCESLTFVSAFFLFCFLRPQIAVAVAFAVAAVDLSLTSWWLFGLFMSLLRFVSSWGFAVVACDCRCLVAFYISLVGDVPSFWPVFVSCCFIITVSVITVLEVSFLVSCRFLRVFRYYFRIVHILLYCCDGSSTLQTIGLLHQPPAR